eukprot:CAMPEP_0172807240 /NCGR_PEP_ID=MMETSP1075-20121228/6874_1 /TAXON_ID=2916 /ORGANISM="Ceratium fusus, Strain PA161109" /LENGTH=463 /DNA_ID=CAMNT_0013646187 /DNA_START=46 /DNA_END=1437 /DNA_ORIENTATION=+
MESFAHQEDAENAELEDLLLNSSSDSDDVMETAGMQNTVSRGRFMKFAVVGMALMALLAASLCFTGFSTIATVSRQHDAVILNEEVSSETSLPVDKKVVGCDQLAIVKVHELVHNNLGGKGPDQGEEGMIYNMGIFMADANGNKLADKKVKVAVHATSPYNMGPGNTYNGLHGKFLSILMRAGEHLNFTIGVYDVDTNEPLTLPIFSITFFDIDMSRKKSSEYIIAQDFEHYYVANGTQLNITENHDGTTTFHATLAGTGADNPEESEALTEFSKEKGVTLEYLKRSSTNFTIGTEEGKSLRGFIFTLRPSMICAKTQYNGTWEDPLNESLPGVKLPLMDGEQGVRGMLLPIIHVTPNGTAIIISHNENITDNSSNSSNNTLENVTISGIAAVVDNRNCTVTIQMKNGTEILEKGTVTSVNGTVIVDTTDKCKQSKAGPTSGTIAMLIVMAQLAMMWPFGNLQ